MVQNSKFRNYLSSLNFSDEEIDAGLLNETTFSYTVDPEGRIAVKYILTLTKEDIYREHRSLWNMNRDNVFIAVSDLHSYIINIKEKPDSERPLKNAICLKSFDYGVNSLGFDEIVPSEISKQYIDSAFFFDFVTKNQRKGQEVDKDLLLNLLQLKSDLINEHNEETIHLIILRCIFIKYLEDRGIFEPDYLVNILKSLDAEQLVSAFNEIKKINGDVFKYDTFEVSDIQTYYLQKLALFFETDYRSGQRFLFPYQFDRIPIQLISHVYEAFLKDNSKKQKGIYYTPYFLVDFMLNQLFSGTDAPDLKKARCLDAAVGSGAFLVECFKRIQASFNRTLSFAEKKKILETQLFGIDIDSKALQIAAFSLYLALLETEDPNFIQREIQYAHPILPSLIGTTLINANAITDDVFIGQTFEYIVSNPPWGSVPIEADAQDEQEATTIRNERKAIANKGKGNGIYAHVADFERSQAFLARFREWMGPTTIVAAVVKNSIFLNDNAEDFRKDLLDNYWLDRFFELSHYNKILFKKKVIGKVKGQRVELGASEPCVVVFLKRLPVETTETPTTIYISPKLSNFAENFEVIHYTSRDSFILSQLELKEEDNYWKVLVNGDLDAFTMIKKLMSQGDLTIEARAGFQPKNNMKSLGSPIWKPIAEPSDFEQFTELEAHCLPVFDWNQNLHRRRDEDIFMHSRIVVPVRPLKSDRFQFRGAIAHEEIVYKHNMISIKLKKGDRYLEDYLPYLAIINSRLLGFLFYQLSIQWGKGEGKRDTIRNVDIEKLPIKSIQDKELAKKLGNVVINIQKRKKTGQEVEKLINELNDLVFEHYELLDYERQIVNEFYEINVDRAAPLNAVSVTDLQNYFDKFTDIFSLVLAKETQLSATYNISPKMGALVCIRLSQQSEATRFKQGADKHIINFVKDGQLNKAEALKILQEDTVKLYDKDHLYLVKSNQFKDWTSRQAIIDARAEIQQFIQHLA